MNEAAARTLTRCGFEVNVKRIYRLYVEERLMIRKKRKRRSCEKSMRVGDEFYRRRFGDWADGARPQRVDAYKRECLTLTA